VEAELWAEVEADEDEEAEVEAGVVEAVLEAVEGAGVVAGLASDCDGVGGVVAAGVAGVETLASVVALSSFLVAGFLVAAALETITTKKSLAFILQDAKVWSSFNIFPA